MSKDAIAENLLLSAARWISGAKASWRTELEMPEQYIFFSNHGSHLDAVVLWALLPEAQRRCCRPIAAKSYWESTALRRYLSSNIFNALLIARPTKESRRSDILSSHKAMFEALEDGSSLIIFPEGTRSMDGRIAPFKAGLHHLAKRFPQVPLVPVYLENMSRILPKGELLPLPLLGSVTFGEPIQLKDAENKSEFLERSRAAILALKEDHDG